MSNYATAAEIRALRGQLPAMDILLPDSEKSVRIRAWTAKERDRFESDVIRRRKASRGDEGAGDDQGEIENFHALAVAHSLVDGEGKQLFLLTDKGQERIDPAAVADIGEWDWSKLRRVWKQVRKLQGLADDEDDEDDEGN